MGLDMYANAVWGEQATELAYWRKFNALHAWMEDLWREQNPNAGENDFNCVDLELTRENLLDLRQALDNDQLEPRGGFFFGPLEIHNEDVDATHLFITKALREIKEGKKVIYSSWW